MADDPLPVDRDGHTPRTSRWLLAAVAACLAAVVVWPILELVRAAADGGWAGARVAFSGPSAARGVLGTVALAVVVTPVTVSLAAAAALATERLPVPAPRLLRSGLLLALLTPGFIAAQSWARAYGPGGLVDDAVGISLPGLFGPFGVALVLVVETMPLAWLVIAAGLAARAEPDLERAARASGASRLDALRTITLPLLLPALLAGGVLVFVLTINAFGVPAVLGLPGGFVTMTTVIYRDLSLSADPAAFSRVIVLATALVAFAGLAVGVADRRGGIRREVLRTGGATGPAGHPGGRAWVPALALWAYIAATILVPLAALLLTALTRAVGLPPTPGNLTLGNFGAALSRDAVASLGHSAVLALAAATTVLGLGALLVSVRRSRTGQAMSTAAVLTFAVPGSTLAVAVLLAYGPLLRDTLTLILVAYVAKFWALGHRVLAGAVDTLPRESVWAARASGARQPVALRTIVVPALAPAVVAGWLLVIVTSLHELTMSTLLYGPGARTLAVAVLNAEELGEVTVTSALAVLLMAVLVAVALVAWLLRPRRISA